ncbi:MAG TPA: hypothetical protein VEG08_05385 [Terriglobales bacterium]|nr:hypothetical protein [Terriglobales bacterium]
MSQQCVDRVVGEILAGWRYDISGIAPEMRGDYEQHFAECARCRARQRLHRTIDLGLIALTTLSAGVFLVAFGAIHYFDPKHALLLELAALAGFLFSLLVWVIVAIATPAPLVMVDAAKLGARRIHEKLPQEIRDRIPNQITSRLGG